MQVAVIGAGRLATALSRRLRDQAWEVTVMRRLLDGEASAVWTPAIARSSAIVIAVPDDAIAVVAAQLASAGADARQVVIHTSGALGTDALEPLRATGAALGSWHPLQSFATKETGFDGVPAIIAGDVRACEFARALSGALAMNPVIEIDDAAKPRYHAAAVFASNYVVALAAVAERLARDAGLGDAASALFLPLMQSTVTHLGQGPLAALTGPIRRGDAATVRRHLSALNGDIRALYVTLGREALQLAREAGLDDASARRVLAVLDG